jgi:hypothetical protein
MADFLGIDVTYTGRAIEAMLKAYPELMEDEDLRADSLEAETDFKALMSRLVRIRGERLALAEGTNGYIKELTERRDRLARGADGLKGLMLKLMATAQLPKLELPEATISISAGRASVSITDIDALPQGTFTTERKPDKAAIKRMIDAGEDIPGAALVAGENLLTIRTK